MKLVTRAALGWPPSAAPLQASTSGVKVHYEGTPVSTRLLADHDACIDEWKAIRASHLANTTENYSDVAYNYAACSHGYLLEGRGIGRRTGANGNQDLNRAHYAIVGLVGSSGLTEPTDAMLHAIRDGIDLLRQNGAGSEIKGHRDGFATSCPGGPLYAWVQRGAPRPGTTPTEEDDMTPEQAKQLADLTTAVKGLAAAVKRIEDKQRIAPWQYKQEGLTDTRDMNQILRDVDKTVRVTATGGMTPEQVSALVKQIATRVAADISARLAN